MYSNPPIHGALLVKTVLEDPALKAQWFGEVRGMAERIISMRALLRRHLEQLGSKRSWAHVAEQNGMFAFSGLSPEQVDELAEKHSIYMTRNGRISMAGVNSRNVARLAAAIYAVTKKE